MSYLSLVTLRYLLHNITHIHCAFSHHCIYSLKHPPWATCAHHLGLHSSVTYAMKSSDSLLGALWYAPMILCECYGTSRPWHYPSPAHVSVSLTRPKAPKRQGLWFFFFNLSMPRASHCISYIDDEQH